VVNINVVMAKAAMAHASGLNGRDDSTACATESESPTASIAKQQLQLLSSQLEELAASLGPHIENTEWNNRREVIRAIVQRIEIGPAAVTIVPRFSVAPSLSVSRTTLSARLHRA